MKIIKKTLPSLFSGSERSKKAKKNIIFSFALKGLSILIGLFYIPILLDVLSQEQYGLWLTISSMVGWISFFDIGFGNGLRNKLAESLALDKIKLSKQYVSTTYYYISIIFLFLTLVFFGVNQFLDWNRILNTDALGNNTLQLVVVIVFSSMCIQFCLKLIIEVLRADQRPTLSNTINPLSNLIVICLIYFGKMFYNYNLFAVSLILSIVPIIVYSIYTIILFNSSYKHIRPSLTNINHGLSKDILGLGFKFFFIKIADLIIYSSSNFLISKLYSPSEVPAYTIVRKYFQISTMVFAIILTPMWSATTEAYVLKDFKWLRNSYKKIFKLSHLFIALLIIMVVVSSYIYKVWIGNKVVIPFSLTIFVALGRIMYMYTAPMVTFINGVGKLKLSVYLTLFQAIAFIPIAVFMKNNTKLGISSIVLAGMFVELPMKVVQIIQFKKIINNKDNGVWSK